MSVFQTYNTEHKREHLLKLAEFLEQPDFEQRHGVRFRMDLWTDKVVPYQGDPNVVVCGTAACMTGYATIALGIPRYKSVESWEEYCCRVLLPDTRIKLIHLNREFRWLFDADWGIDDVTTEYGEEAPDNTPQGGAARIRYYLANGVPSDDLGPQVYAGKCDFDKEKYLELIKPYHVDYRKSS